MFVRAASHLKFYPFRAVMPRIVGVLDDGYTVLVDGRSSNNHRAGRVIRERNHTSYSPTHDKVL